VKIHGKTAGLVVTANTDITMISVKTRIVGRDWRCPLKPPVPAVSARMRAWWLERLSPDELLERGDLLGWR
jgi:hypothetical protein